MRTGLIFGLALALLCAMPAIAATWVVTDNGSDPGTAGTFMHALTNAVDGDTITWEGDMTMDMNAAVQPGYQDLNITTYVVYQDDLTIDGAGHDVVWDGLGTTDSGIYVVSANVVVRGITIFGKGDAFHVPKTGEDGAGESGGNVLFENCTAYNCSNMGFKLEQTNTTVRNCVAYNNGRFGVGIDPWQFGNVADGSVIEGCELYGHNTDWSTWGIVVTNSSNITIRNNYLYNNSSNIWITSDDNAPTPPTGLVIGGNMMGFDATGTAYPMPGGNGMVIAGFVEEVIVGGFGAGKPNLIAGAWDGVWIADGATGLTIRGNSIYDNDGEGENEGTGRVLGWDGTVVPTAAPAGLSLGSVMGNGGPANADIDVYVDTAAPGDPAGTQARTYIGSATSDGGGDWTLDVDVASLYPGLYVTAMATDASGNTSNVATGIAIPGTPKLDTDNDGMPDEFETTNGFDPDNPLDAFGDADENGTSNVMEYISGSSGPAEEVPAASVWGLMAAAVAVAAAGTGLVIRRNNKK